jgi:hypothetical protein
MRGASAIAIGFSSLAKAGFCGVATLLTAWSPVGWRRSLIRGALHVGALARTLGAPDLVMYGAADPGASQSARPASTAQTGV